MDTISHTTTALPALADRAQRYDGWTPDRQRAFLEAIAEGHTVGSACALVGMAPSSAYALRRRAAGAAFALGWRAATLLAREKVADTLLARAIDGQVETITRPDGETITRHRVACPERLPWQAAEGTTASPRRCSPASIASPIGTPARRRIRPRGWSPPSSTASSI